MGKRTISDFERIPKDKYQTPFKPVPFLIPYLQRDGITTFAEFCCGDGQLIQHLESFGLKCNYRGDIATGQDALKTIATDYNGAQVGITNPPFKDEEDTNPHSTKLLRALIRHSLDLGIPFWLLLPHDFSTNEYASPLLDFCSDIVVAGRVQWIANSKYESGFDNSCWYRFDAKFAGTTAFHNDRGKSAQLELALQMKQAAE